MTEKAKNSSGTASLVEIVQAVVVAVIPEFHQSLVSAADGREFAITKHTEGVRFDDLVEGQVVNCVVTRKLPRVIRAWLYCDAPRLAPFFMPEVAQVAQINTRGALTVQELAVRAQIQTADSNPSKRKIVLLFDAALPDGELGPIQCEDVPEGTVSITLSTLLNEADGARQALAVLAFALLEPHARRVIRGEDWTRAKIRTVADGPVPSQESYQRFETRGATK